ncbi:MAG: SpoIIE family protein phosphatase [Zoogloeaceae bacterium]|nr:SpoIIE family protein phosphatase [Zoogloeaceae bacterium]MCK6385304.1 SpoIIE family protein phosphatase [Rhodocyclaceae bacterium]
MRILLVDADPAARATTAAQLRGMGLDVVEAGDGGAALDACAREAIDLVVTELELPGLSGYALTRALRQRAYLSWQPVIVLTTVTGEDAVLETFDAGADAFLRKPIEDRSLHARLRPIMRAFMLQQESEARERELQQRYQAEEEEKRLAQHLMRRLINEDKLNDPAIECWISPAQTLSGDLVAAARTPGGVLHVLLADGTGHGLAASLNVLPITAPFYRMTERGFGIGAIARELNVKLREMMPADRFVAATLVEMDPRELLVKVWNGGNPMLYLIGPAGSGECVFASTHLPLGLADDDAFDESVESCAFDPGSRLVLFSDGLTEAENAAGEAFGEERLARLLTGNPPGWRMRQVKDAVAEHLAGVSAHDDISLVLVRCDGAEAPQPEPAAAAAAPASGPAGAWRLALRLGPDELRGMDVVPVLLALLQNFELLRAHGGALFIVLSELFNNALDHGVLGLSSALKHSADGMERYLDERARRLRELREGQVEIVLEMEDRLGMDSGDLWIHCRDSGAGFDYKNVGADDGSGERSAFGRGLTLVRSLCDGLEFAGCGNQAVARLSLRREQPAAAALSGAETG